MTLIGSKTSNKCFVKENLFWELFFSTHLYIYIYAYIVTHIHITFYFYTARISYLYNIHIYNYIPYIIPCITLHSLEFLRICSIA